MRYAVGIPYLIHVSFIDPVMTLPTAILIGIYCGLLDRRKKDKA